MTKRIACISHLSEISGGTVALVDTAVGLRKAGFDVTLVFPEKGPILERAAEKGIPYAVVDNPTESLAAAGIVARPALLARRARYVITLAAFLKENRFDLAYINTSASLFPGFAARSAGIPIVWHIHETLPSDSLRNRIKAGLIRRLSRGLLYASESGIQTLPPGNLPFLIVRNSIAYEKMQAVRDRRRRKMGHPPSEPASSGEFTPHLLLNGTIRRKGADVFLDAVQLLSQQPFLRSPRITIVGLPTTDPAFFQQLQRHPLVTAHPGLVEFPGILPSLAPLLETATLYISASRNEAMPIAVVEAMAAGVPVIATDVGDCASLLEGSRCGWVVPPEDAAALAAALAEALTSPDERRRRAHAAAEKVDALYAPDQFWQPLVQFLGRL